MMFGKYSIVGSAQHVKKNENSEVMKTLWILSIFHTISNTPKSIFGRWMVMKSIHWKLSVRREWWIRWVCAALFMSRLHNCLCQNSIMKLKSFRRTFGGSRCPTDGIQSKIVPALGHVLQRFHACKWIINSLLFWLSLLNNSYNMRFPNIFWN